MNNTTSRHIRIAIGFFLALITLLVYWKCTEFGFVGLDDPYYVYNNPHVSTGLTLNNIKWALRPNYETSNWHPVTWWSLMLDATIFDLDPSGFHLTNIVLHALNAVLLFLVLEYLTGFQWRSAFVAGLFALHPLHVESVAWVTERKDVLSTLFMLLTIFFYAQDAKRKDKRSYALMIACFILGLAAKPMLVSLPILLLLLDYWPLNRLKSRKDLWLLIDAKTQLIMLAGMSCLITFWTQRVGQAVASLEFYTPGIRLANAAVSYLGYLGKMIWPTKLAAYYVHPCDTLPSWQVIAATATLATISYAAWKMRYERPYILVGWLWYVVSLVPVIGIVQVASQAMADRYTYVPLIGIFVVLAWAVGDLVTSLSGKIGRAARLGVAGIALAVLAALTSITTRQINVWENDYTLMRHAVKVNPHNWFAHNFLGEIALKQGQVRTAEKHFRAAITSEPRYELAHFNLGELLMNTNRPKEAEKHFKAILKQSPDNPFANAALGQLALNASRYKEAAHRFRKALHKNPKDAFSLNGMGHIYEIQGKMDLAVDYYERAAALDPNNNRYISDLERVRAWDDD